VRVLDPSWAVQFGVPSGKSTSWYFKVGLGCAIRSRRRCDGSHMFGLIYTYELTFAGSVHGSNPRYGLHDLDCHDLDLFDLSRFCNIAKQMIKYFSHNMMLSHQ
jgi:hypothetical protein